MERIRLSDLLRQGAEMTEHVRVTYVDEGEKDYVCKACAQGAIDYALVSMLMGTKKVREEEITGISTTEQLDGFRKSLNDVYYITLDQEDLPDELVEVKEYTRTTVVSAIIDLNDLEEIEWSREAIAEWLDWLIDERGYDLHLELENEEEAETTPEKEKAPVT